jgi:hypothetical protein
VSAGRGVKFSLSDKQWKKINEHLRLPDAARADLESAISGYVEPRLLWKSPPSAVRKELNRTSAAALKLVELLERFGRRELLELSEVGHGRKRLDSTIAEVKAIKTACAEASMQVSDVRWTYWQDTLINNLDRILWEHAGKRVSRGKVLPFLTAVCKMADPKFGSGAVVLAVQRFKPSVRFQEKEISKPATDSRR